VILCCRHMGPAHPFNDNKESVHLLHCFMTTVAMTWAPLPPLPQTRAYGAAVTIDECRILVLGGQGPQRPHNYVSLEEYDSTTKAWASRPWNLISRYMLAAAVVALTGGDIYAIGGVCVGTAQTRGLEGNETKQKLPTYTIQMFGVQ
jgi:hypothetical protein